MRKNLSMFLVTVSACTLFAGCGSERVNQEEAVNNQTVAINLESDNSNSDEDLPTAYVYTTADNIIPMSESATIDGVTYQVLKCEVTSEFGDRNLDNLNYFYDDGGIDDSGNLTNNSRYIFLTIQYTNTTDSEIEINQGGKGIYFLDEHYIVTDYNGNSVYIDMENSEKPANERDYYDLKPGESITSEVGWVISKDTLDAYDKIYNVVRQVDCWTESGGATDPNAIYIELEY
jgi:hypothetical protein